ncbi:fasciclin domain-containing protein [Nocardia sp. NPDC058176]|uniref:fasciclin domain-containing protein n=1 Tax=Nocardia sp. NPDC058176 TaxID=3346368 RepID=UPI0036DADDAE
MRIKHTTMMATAVLAAAVLGTSACSDSDSDTADATTTMSPPAMTTTDAPAGTPAAGPVGPGCAEYAAQVPDGPGSVSGMAQEPVAVAASNNPMLTTLVSAVSGQLNPDVNLVDTLNSGEFTVFAPVDSAFAKLDPATVETLKTDSAMLTQILTYHVVPGRIEPGQISGTHTTVEGADVTVEGSGETFTVADASVICGGVQTANATVYMIDSVLQPPAA